MYTGDAGLVKQRSVTKLCCRHQGCHPVHEEKNLLFRVLLTMQEGQAGLQTTARSQAQRWSQVERPPGELLGMQWVLQSRPQWVVV
jgi:hypothetical protein